MRKMVKVVVLLLALSMPLPAAALEGPQEASWAEQLWALLAENLPSFGEVWDASTGDQEPSGEIELGPANDPNGTSVEQTAPPEGELGPIIDPHG